MGHDPYDLELGSDRFIRLCTRLNETPRRDDASWSNDAFSGGFKFSDEIPAGFGETPEETLPFVTLLRCLWAYRVSLVEGRPRAELAPTWEATRRLAPEWAGFSPDRCSDAMQPILDEVKARSAQFTRDIDDMEARWSRRRPVAMDEASGAGVAVVDGEPMRIPPSTSTRG